MTIHNPNLTNETVTTALGDADFDSEGNAIVNSEVGAKLLGIPGYTQPPEVSPPDEPDEPPVTAEAEAEEVSTTGETGAEILVRPLTMEEPPQPTVSSTSSHITDGVEEDSEDIEETGEPARELTTAELHREAAMTPKKVYRKRIPS